MFSNSAFKGPWVQSLALKKLKSPIAFYSPGLSIPRLEEGWPQVPLTSHQPLGCNSKMRMELTSSRTRKAHQTHQSWGTTLWDVMQTVMWKEKRPNRMNVCTRKALNLIYFM